MAKCCYHCAHYPSLAPYNPCCDSCENYSKFQAASYRDILVRAIQDAERELIDRAPDMVSKNLDMITDFEIHIQPMNMEGPPIISFTTRILNKTYEKHFYSDGTRK